MVWGAMVGAWVGVAISPNVFSISFAMGVCFGVLAQWAYAKSVLKVEK